jgi:hypothetical protein
MAGLVVRLAGLTFNDGPDNDGDEFWVGEITGWDGAGVDLVTVNRPISSGSVVVRGRRAARALVMTGEVISLSLTRARRKLAAAFDSIIEADGTLEVDEYDGTYTLAVRLTTQLRTRDDGTYGLTFEADLIAADPVKVLAAS